VDEGVGDHRHARQGVTGALSLSMTISSNDKRPLAGMRVIDLATMIAAPFCAGMLGEFGAEVIKVELPGSGDPLRQFGTANATGSSFNWLNEGRNKKAVTLDIRKPEGAELLKRLVAKSDVLVENFRPGTLEKWGLDYETLKAIKPDLILVRVSAYGQDGPYRNRPGYARVAHGFAGLTHLAGDPNGPPVVPGSTALADYISGMYAALGALLALLARERHCIAQVVDVGLYEGIFRMLDELVPVYAATGFVRNRMGADTVNAAPHSHYRTRDNRWVALACSSDKMWERLARVMDRMDLVTPETYAFVKQRMVDVSGINAIVQDWMERHDQAEIMEKCLAGEVPLGPINTVADIFEDPQFQARGNLLCMPDAREGTVTIPNTIPRLSVTPGRVESLGPDLGQHNEEIYGTLLGLTVSDLSALRQKGLI
jgi:crotonobetainyl-CoA:carnitine CoA-transferase CaiB-like acyl-CoA transferase